MEHDKAERIIRLFHRGFVTVSALASLFMVLLLLALTYTNGAVTVIEPNKTILMVEIIGTTYGFTYLLCRMLDLKPV